MKNYILFCAFFFSSIITFSQHELWGTVSNGGNYGHGYIFKCDSVGDNLVIVHHFDSLNGSNPGALLAASNNKLYGLTFTGGINGGGLFSAGTFYEYDLTTSTHKVIQHFGPGNTEITGVKPSGDGFRTLTEVSPGLIYGQILGAYTGGVIFSYDAATEETEVVVNIPTFMGDMMNTIQGNRLVGNLYLAPDGFLYGTTHRNSQCPIPNPNFGSIIRINPITHAYSVSYLSPCLATNGTQFENHFAVHDDKLYSVTKIGGAFNKGVIYSFDPATNTYVNEYNFEGDTFGFNASAMVKMPNGKFYGLADGGTPETYFPNGCGILYEYDPAADQFTKKLDFSYDMGYYMNVGPFPFSLIDGTNGKLYGVNANGVFEYNIDLNETTPKGRMPIGMGWYPAGTPSLTAVCRKPSHVLTTDTSMTFCEGENMIFDLQSDNSDSYTWTQNGTTNSMQTTGTLSINTLSATDAGTWICEMTNVCGSSVSAEIEVIVNTVSTPTITQTGTELHASVAGSYQWIDCDNANAVIPGEINAVFTPTVNGNYAVITTENNCADTSDCFAVTDLGLPTHLQGTEMQVFPNPATNSIQFATTDPIESVIIMNAAGQVVMRGKSAVMDISTLSPGSYFFIIQTTTGNGHGKFVKGDL